MAKQTALAYMLRELRKESVAIANLQSCRYQADGGTLTYNAPEWTVRIPAAKRCEQNYREEVARKECVARAFVRR
jgi:hypothetical protein